MGCAFKGVTDLLTNTAVECYKCYRQSKYRREGECRHKKGKGQKSHLRRGDS